MYAHFYRFKNRLLRLNSPDVTSRLRTNTCFDSLTYNILFEIYASFHNESLCQTLNDGLQ